MSCQPLEWPGFMPAAHGQRDEFPEGWQLARETVRGADDNAAPAQLNARCAFENGHKEPVGLAEGLGSMVTHAAGKEPVADVGCSAPFGSSTIGAATPLRLDFSPAQMGVLVDRPSAAAADLRRAQALPTHAQFPPQAGQVEGGGQAKLWVGKHRGRSFEEIQRTDPPYCKWVLSLGQTSGCFAAFTAFLRGTAALPGYGTSSGGEFGAGGRLMAERAGDGVGVEVKLPEGTRLPGRWADIRTFAARSEAQKPATPQKDPAAEKRRLRSSSPKFADIRGFIQKRPCAEL